MFYNETNVKLQVFNFALCSSSATTAASMLHNINERPHFLQKRKTTSAAKSHCRCRTFAPWATVFVSAPDPRNVFSLSVSVAHSLLFLLQKNCRPASPRTRETSLMDLLSLSPLLSKLSVFLSFFTKSAPFKTKSRENCPQPQDVLYVSY